jgi:hypothetical protein
MCQQSKDSSWVSAGTRDALVRALAHRGIEEVAALHVAQCQRRRIGDLDHAGKMSADDGLARRLLGAADAAQAIASRRAQLDRRTQLTV